MLLYWDQVSSIIPYDFLHNPEALGPYMQSLLREELVFQIMPGAYIYEIPRFFEAFSGYLDNLGPEIDARRKRFALGNTFRIHIEKLGDIGDMLIRHRLATLERYPWHLVERETAEDFMSYLASSLGQVQSIDSSPVTDDDAYLMRLARAGVPQEAMTRQLESLRVQVLDQILPVPKHSLQPSQIRAFKDRHRDELGDFRRRVERELIDASNINDHALRQRHLEIFFEEAQERVKGIQEAMRGAGWETVRAGFSVVAALPGVSPLIGLCGALWNALTGGPQQIQCDFAYAAHAQSEFQGPLRVPII